MRMRGAGFSSQRSLAVLVVGATLTVALPSLAQAPSEPAPEASEPASPPSKQDQQTAEESLAEGIRAYEAGDYTAAEEHFTKSASHVASADAAYWLAKTLSASQKTAPALTAWQAFLNHPEANGLGEDKLAEAQAQASELEAKLVGKLSLTVSPIDASVSVNGQQHQAEAPLELELKPGKYRVVVSAPGFETQELELELAAGQSLQQSIELVAEAPPPPAPAAPPPDPAPAAPAAAEESEPSMLPAYITLGAAGAAAAVGTVFGLRALSAKSDYEDDPTQDNLDDLDRNALIADMSFSFALTLGLTGAVLLLSDDGAQEQETASAARSTVTVAPFVGPKGGGAAARFLF